MYPIYQVPDEAAISTEPLGTKSKFWFKRDAGELLFKQPRQNTGEDWSEKVAGELCELLNLPHAHYDLALWKGQRGVVTPNFAPRPYRLVHGNELLARIDNNYPSQRYFRVQEHKLKTVLKIIKVLDPGFPVGWAPISPINVSVEIFVGYLLLDAWIGNQDRHHENWGFVVIPPVKEGDKFKVHLAPTYDHASSLGRNESDSVRQDRLNTKDMGRHISKYVEKANSAFYDHNSNLIRPLSTLDAFLEAAKIYKDAATLWLDKLNMVTEENINDILMQIPSELITEPAVEFARAMLDINRRRLMSVKDQL